MPQSPPIPTHADLLWPTLQAVRALGGSGSIGEINATVIEVVMALNAPRNRPR